uniref:Uncharacterized protein n=1 Tax=Glossina palpalis gambiensis TaxID=67801 RepID=A0A1B0BW04_9MUSC
MPAHFVLPANTKVFIYLILHQRCDSSNRPNLWHIKLSKCYSYRKFSFVAAEEVNSMVIKMRIDNHIHIRHIMLYHFEKAWIAAQSFRDPMIDEGNCLPVSNLARLAWKLLMNQTLGIIL